MSDRLSRRDFLGYSGATLAGITLGEWGRRHLARADERAQTWQPQSVERWATSVCRECPAACGIRVRLVDETPVKLEGNPRCPIGRGRLCARGQAAIESYFDPDRLVGPARRAGGRHEQRWQAITWAAATALLASRLRDAGGGRVLAVAAEEHGPLADLWSRFWHALDARTVWSPAPTAARLRPRLEALTGVDADPVFDLERATHVLSFGAPIVETWLSPVWSQRSYGRFRRDASRLRGRLVHIEGRRSLTARKADEWLPLAADRQTFLAYGIASVLLREQRVNSALLTEAGGNLADFEREVVARYSPDAVAEATGIPVVTVLRLARELVASGNPLVVVAADADPALVDAVFALDALVGAFDRPGGLFSSPATPLRELEDAGAAIDDLASARRPRPRVVALRDAAALRALGAPPDLAGNLRDVDLVVSFSPYLDETAAVADLLLPTHTPLERWHGVIPPPCAPIEALALSRPAVTPRLDTRDEAALLKELATAIGGPVATACGWSTSEDVIASELDRLWKARRGGPFSDDYETHWLRQLETGGWWTAAADTPSEFADAVVDAGGWADPFFEAGQIVQTVRARGGLTFAMPLVTPRAVAPSRSFPLRLLPFTPTSVSAGSNPNHPSLYELLGQPEGTPWRVWAEINPETAAASGVPHGATMRITSPRGSIDVEAIHVDGMPADIVALAFVPAVPSGGRWARLLDGDARRLLEPGAQACACAIRVARG